MVELKRMRLCASMRAWAVCDLASQGEVPSAKEVSRRWVVSLRVARGLLGDADIVRRGFWVMPRTVVEQMIGDNDNE